jgi:hypothetical protein
MSDRISSSRFSTSQSSSWLSYSAPSCSTSSSPRHSSSGSVSRSSLRTSPSSWSSQLRSPRATIQLLGSRSELKEIAGSDLLIRRDFVGTGRYKAEGAAEIAKRTLASQGKGEREQNIHGFVLSSLLPGLFTRSTILFRLQPHLLHLLQAVAETNQGQLRRFKAKSSEFSQRGKGRSITLPLPPRLSRDDLNLPIIYLLSSTTTSPTLSPPFLVPLNFDVIPHLPSYLLSYSFLHACLLAQITSTEANTISIIYAISHWQRRESTLITSISISVALRTSGTFNPTGRTVSPSVQPISDNTLSPLFNLPNPLTSTFQLHTHQPGLCSCKGSRLDPYSSWTQLQARILGCQMPSRLQAGNH